MNLKLNITNSNIAKGEQVNPSNCPIARNIRSKVKSLRRVSVLGETATITKNVNGRLYTFIGKLPAEARKFVKQFDAGKAVAPFAFKLSLCKVERGVAVI
jgi:hypothetical protein